MDNSLVTSAQNREDLYLFALLGDIKKGFYVDVGANHVDLHSVTKLFYDRGWRGVNVEPNPILFKEFKKYRKRDINVNAGASNKTGKLKFRTYPHHDGFSTFSEAIMKLHEKENIPYEDSVVPIKTLKKILTEAKVKEIDFMKIDVEGYEIEVLEGNDWDAFRPKVLVIEATMRDELDKYLKKRGYSLEFFDGLNNYYIDSNFSKQITIHNYASRVLSTGVYTTREQEAYLRIKVLEEDLAKINIDLAAATEALERIQGLKNSVLHTVRSARTYANKRLGAQKKR